MTKMTEFWIRIKINYKIILLVQEVIQVKIEHR
jgi:hypothetical protein